MSGDIRSSDSEEISEESNGTNSIHLGNGDASKGRWDRKINDESGKKL